MTDLRITGTSAGSVIQALGLKPHPEGGHYRETWRDQPPDSKRGAGTAILFLLAAGERSHWHRVDAAELWIWQAGALLLLRVQGQPDLRLGPVLADGNVLQAVVPKDIWQTAHSLGDWTLVSCVVTPAFQFEGFELAPPGWEPST